MTARVRRILFAGVACLVAVPALAQLDTTLRPVIVRAGPDAMFPSVERLPTATNVHVHGCLATRSWCDIQAGRTRGWVDRADLSPSSRVRNAPEVVFSLGDYWDAHYRRRPWYADRDRWLAWDTPGFAPPGRPAR